MNSRLFETFREKIDCLPPEAVLKAVGVEWRKLEEDLAQAGRGFGASWKRIWRKDERSQAATQTQF